MPLNDIIADSISKMTQVWGNLIPSPRFRRISEYQGIGVSRKALGFYVPSTQTIYLLDGLERLVLHTTLETIVHHELAHHIAYNCYGKAPHDSRWKRIARLLGINEPGRLIRVTPEEHFLVMLTKTSQPEFKNKGE